MNKLELNSASLLKDLVENYGVLGIKTSFEDEGASFNEVLRLKELCNQASTKLLLKISGAEAKRDLVKQTIKLTKTAGWFIEASLKMEEILSSAGAPVVTDAPATTGVDPAQAWPQITDAMRGIAKAIFKPAVIESVEGKKIVIRLPNNTPVKRAQEQVATVVAAIKQVCGTTYAVTLVQADPTSPAGMKRPVVAEVDETEQKTIDIVVAEDPYAEIDLSETIAIDNSVDPMLEALTSSFPEGVIMDETPAAEAPPAPKSPKSPRGRK